MDQAKWQVVKENFGEREFIKDGYYRVRENTPERFELAFLVAGVCGDNTPHPRIIVEIKEGQARATQLMDFESNPLKRVMGETPEELAQLQVDADALLDHFIAAKHLA